MPATLRGLDRDGLERSCGDAIRFGPAAPGVERAAVRLESCAFEPHRHDTYAIGLTLAGIQSFRYRGAARVCLPGQLHVLHPDETHTGGPGTDDGLRYRIVYVAPGLVREALGGRALPFVADPVHEPPPAARALLPLIADVDEPLDELRLAEAVAAVADALVAMSGGGGGRTPVDLRAMDRVRERLAEEPRDPVPAAELERIAGIDRYAIARQFRSAFATSPDRYRTLRRLELARAAVERGEPLARAAADAGFADQSHMTRQFKRAYGFTPARWAALTACGQSPRVRHRTGGRPPLPSRA